MSKKRDRTRTARLEAKLDTLQALLLQVGSAMKAMAELVSNFGARIESGIETRRLIVVDESGKPAIELVAVAGVGQARGVQLCGANGQTLAFLAGDDADGGTLSIHNAAGKPLAKVYAGPEGGCVAVNGTDGEEREALTPAGYTKIARDDDDSGDESGEWNA